MLTRTPSFVPRNKKVQTNIFIFLYLILGFFFNGYSCSVIRGGCLGVFMHLNVSRFFPRKDCWERVHK